MILADLSVNSRQIFHDFLLKILSTRDVSGTSSDPMPTWTPLNQLGSKGKCSTIPKFTIKQDCMVFADLSVNSQQFFPDIFF